MAALACCALLTSAQAAESAPLQIVVPYAAGGAVDVVTRIVGQKMGEVLGTSIIVENRPGAATNIGTQAVVRSAPNGNTLLTASNTLASNGALYSRLPFDPAKDLAPVGSIGYAPLVIVVPAASSYKKLGDLIEDAKSHPDRLSYASAGNGSSGHLASELLKHEAGFNAVHVPYKGGSPAITDLLGGRISFMAINPVEVIAHIQAGRLRTLALLDTKPSPLLPAVPTISSLGFPGAAASVWWGLVGPKGIDANRLASLNAALQKSLADPGVHKRLVDLGVTETPGSAADFDAFVNGERAKWTKVIRDADIHAD
jgi:tripartite-type tricarboxylate transporter receptor subunit TctC